MKRENITKIITIIILIIAIMITINIPKLFASQKEDILPEVKLKEINKNKTFAIMVSNDTRDGYTTYNGNKWPTSEEDYYYNHAECVDNKGNIVNDAIKYNEEENKATLTSNSTIYCTLYFDKYNYMKVITHSVPFNNTTLLASNYMSTKVKDVEFKNETPNLNNYKKDETYWDISDTSQGTPAGSVIAWTEPIDNTEFKTLYIGSKTKIRTLDLSYAFITSEYENDTANPITNLESINFNDMLDTYKTTNMFRAFYYCTKLKELKGLENWNTENVTNMRTLFGDCRLLDNFDFLENWDVSKVENIGFMFYGDNLTNLNVLKKWQLKSIKYMDSLFRDCTNLSDISLLSNWDVSKVTDMKNLFNGTPIKDEDLNVITNWNTFQVTIMSGMFRGCKSLTDVNLLNNWNVSNVTNMDGLFAECSNLQNVNLSSWDTSKVTDMHAMFLNCTSLKTIDMSNATFTQITENANYLNMFLNVPFTAILIVKDQTQNDWIKKAGFQGTINVV